MLTNQYALHFVTLSLQILYDACVLLLALDRIAALLLRLLQLEAQRALQLHRLVAIPTRCLQFGAQHTRTLVQMLHVQLEHLGLLLQTSVLLAQCTLRLRQGAALQTHRGQTFLGVLQALLQLLNLTLERVFPRHAARYLLDGRAEGAHQMLWGAAHRLLAAAGDGCDGLVAFSSRSSCSSSAGVAP